MSEILWRINLKLGEVIFKNRAGLIGNIGGRLNLMVCRLVSDVDKDISIGDKGFREIDVDVEEESDDIKQKFDEVIESGDVHEAEKNGETLILSHGTGQEFDSEKFEAIESAVNKVAPYVESYFGSHFEPIYIKMMRYLDGEEEDHFARSWHMDEYTPDHIRIFILLSDVTEEQGSSCFIPREDTKKALKKIDGNFKQDKERWDSFDKNHFYGEKGSVALADPVQNFHRGTNSEDQREIAIVTVRPSPRPLGHDWLDDVGGLEGPEDVMNLASLSSTLGLR
jgi:hypothetical protein